MATILVVEDHAMSRQVLKTLLGYMGHRVLEAADGSAALALARSEQPDLVISDILMPTMDGVEFVRRLREEEALRNTPVIFYSATYRMPEAIRLGQAVGVNRVIPKPSDPVFILKTVNEILGLSPVDTAPPPTTDQLYNSLRKSESFQSAGLRLAAVMDLSFHLVSQSDPGKLMFSFCRAAQDVMKCEYATLALIEEDGKTRYFNGSSRNEECDVCPNDLLPLSEILDRVVAHRSTLRRHRSDVGSEGSTGPTLSQEPEKSAIRNPQSEINKAFRSLLAIPVASPSRVYGWICLADKLDRQPFSDGDEEIGVALSTQAAMAYENILLMEEQRRRAEELETANKELAAFIYSVSHDLRAPLRTISGFIKILEADFGDWLDAQGRDYLKRVYNGSEKMSKLIEDLLYLSRISRQAVDRMEFNISKRVSSILAQLRDASPGRKVEVSVEDGLVAFADMDLTDIVLNNLLGNAWKFTSNTEHARIEFGSLNQDGKTAFYVRDNGAGFNPAYKEKLFWPFQRLHTSAEFEGTGIGLTNVERIIRRHGGKVWAEGEVGKGATFFFTLN